VSIKKVIAGLTLLLLLGSKIEVAVSSSMLDFVYDESAEEEVVVTEDGTGSSSNVAPALSTLTFEFEDSDTSDFKTYATVKYGMKVLNSGDVETAISMWKYLAKEGNTEAQHQLGLHYYGGVKSFPQNYKNALKWFTKAAKQGDSDSQILLGLMYENAQGVLIDYRIAYMWMNLGGYNGYGSSHHMDRLIKKMVPADISRAQKMSKRCLKSDYTDCKDSFFDKFYSIFE